MYLVAPAKKLYVEMPMTEQRLPGNMPVPPGIKILKDEKTELGKEEVAGYQTTKYRQNLELDVQGQKMTVVSIMWFAPEFDLPLRSEVEGETQRQELRNIKIGAVPAATFDIPSDYKKAKDEQDFMMQVLQAK